MAEEEDIELLEQMLLNAEAEEEKSEQKQCRESLVRPQKNTYLEDSSDEEESKELYSKYNDYGRDINKKLKEVEEIKKFNSIKVTNGPTSNGMSQSFKSSLPTTSLSLTRPISNSVPSNGLANKETVFCDPVFGIKIINPAISSVVMKERMTGKIPVGVQRARFHTERGDRSQDWVIAGVIVGKSPVKTTQKGDQFSIWTLSDLRGEIKTVTLFLFRAAHRELWKNNIGTVIAVLNPQILERKDEKVEAVLSVSDNKAVMILGQSKDLGKCKSKKNNGEVCGAIVNKSECDVCIFHMKKEYGKFKRSELQSDGLGRGLQDLRNKVLGKSEVFYAGQSFMAQKAKKPVKQMLKDRDRMTTLSEYYSVPYNSEAPVQSVSVAARQMSRTPNAASNETTNAIKRAASLDLSGSQRKKDIERLKMLQGTDSPQILLTPKFVKEKESLFSSESPKVEPAAKKDPNFVPKLSGENLTFSFSVPKNKNDVAKQKALQVLKKKPLETSNPNLIKYRGTEAGKKRIADELNTSLENDPKKAKLSVDDEARKKKEFIERMMNAKSAHGDLAESLEREKQQKCMDRLEKKEAMEERMANTMEMKCKAVICRRCKYIYFSASDMCKEQRHELKVVDATKRFYQCTDCKKRTVTLFRIPREPCRHCNSMNWKRTGMIAERIAYLGEQLSIRGDEEMFIGSATKANVNLLVPESEK
ncbi:protein MCM10 homolog [Chironomus tepperi]|uniref:protein MCM10 homolog n=1 Tax=Chironomus tepperi TaxID=113505 RepID=UPI00391FA81E